MAPIPTRHHAPAGQQIARALMLSMVEGSSGAAYFVHGHRSPVTSPRGRPLALPNYSGHRFSTFELVAVHGLAFHQTFPATGDTRLRADTAAPRTAGAVTDAL